MALRIARIDTSFYNSFNHKLIVNIEVWDAVPAPVGNFIFRQIDHLNSSGNPSDTNAYQYPVGTSCSIDLGTPDTYFDMNGNPVILQAV